MAEGRNWSWSVKIKGEDKKPTDICGSGVGPKDILGKKAHKELKDAGFEFNRKVHKLRMVRA